MPNDFQATLNHVLELLQRPFWMQASFWISFIVGVVGVVVGGFGVHFSMKAFDEAKEAKRAAKAAGRTIKLQTIAIELTQISQKCDRLVPDIRFNEARDILTETSFRLLRATSPFAKEDALSQEIAALRQALDVAHASLNSVRPTDPTKESEVPNAVYYAIQDDFAMINNCIAVLLGLFEKQSFDFGEKNAES